MSETEEAENGPKFMDKFWYRFDVWYTSDPMAEVYLLAAVNAFFVFLLFVTFTITGSLTDLSGFEVTQRSIRHKCSVLTLAVVF
jgi:hypothetical protein